MDNVSDYMYYFLLNCGVSKSSRNHNICIMCHVRLCLQCKVLLCISTIINCVIYLFSIMLIPHCDDISERNFAIFIVNASQKHAKVGQTRSHFVKAATHPTKLRDNIVKLLMLVIGWDFLSLNI